MQNNLIDQDTLVVDMDAFTPRAYQIPIFRAMDRGAKKLVVVAHRRFGKDLIGINLTIREAFKRRGTYAYILPTYRQAKNIIWKGMTKDGTPFLDYIPKELIRKKHVQDLSIELINGSRIMLLGSNNYDSLRGVNPVGIVFSEYAYQHPQVYATMSPVINENGGWMYFQSTPFGENHFFDIYSVATQFPEEWFSYKQTVKDTGIITQEQIDKEIRDNLISPDMVQQEYFCDFSVGALGSYYAKYVNDLDLAEQIGDVPWDKGKPVYTACDLGMNDATVILFFQLDGRRVNIIDMHFNSNVGLEYYAHYIKSKPYTYARHIAPHDIRVRDQMGGGMQRWDKMRELGIEFDIAPNLSVIDGIEIVRSQFNRLWIDETKCRRLITALRDYRKEYDEKAKRYKNKPLHDSNSDFCDALRYLCISLNFLSDGMTEQEAERLRRDAFRPDSYGHNPFRDKHGTLPTLY